MAGRFRIKDSDPGFRNFRSQLKKGPSQVNIGLFSEQGADPVIYAASNEFGTTKIPERSFLRSTVDEQKGKFRSFLAKNKNSIVVGPQQREEILKRLGQLAENEIVRKINKGPFTPNKPATIRAKGSSKPLIDTGRMRQSIISKVVK